MKLGRELICDGPGVAGKRFLMRRIWGVGTLALLAALVPVQAAQAGDDDHLPDQIDLPNG
jgi:hypothetical protein